MSGNSSSNNKSTFNKYAALDDDDEQHHHHQQQQQQQQPTQAAGTTNTTSAAPSHTTKDGVTVANSRSEALRTAVASNRSTSAAATTTSKTPGRSLADLAAARGPELRERSASYGSASSVKAGMGIGSNDNSSGAPTTSIVVCEEKVIRYTRERLLSMRPHPGPAPPPDIVTALEGTVILSDQPLDPVCWDTFDAEAIWAAVAKERRAVKPPTTEPGDRRTTATTTNTRREGRGRWERGVALPPPDSKKREEESGTDLWDDPQASEAATDFSAFGSMPADDEPFDFDKMAEATKKFEEEIHGNRSRASSDASPEELAQGHTVKVDPKRPLASIGTTIKSGTLDEVNVFEDFDDPLPDTPESASKPLESPPTIKAGDEDPDASSRLMAMIGVTKPAEPIAQQEPEPIVAPPAVSAWGVPEPPKPIEPAVSIPLNPWGGTLLPGQQNVSIGSVGPIGGFDLEARMRMDMEQKAREEALRRQQEEEAKRLAEERTRAQQMRQQQQGVQSQVELVLMERISAILENSWGQSDLISILSTLHAEDSRVIPLLSNTDALRALIMRNPRRVGLRPNPVFGTEMAILVMTNAQWQQAQQVAQAQQELQKRRADGPEKVIPGAPWYYSDPQNNIQGPFRGEEMRQWLEAGYFKADLPISQKQSGPFFALKAIFTDLSVAFLTPNEADEESLREKALMEAKRAEALARERAEREAREAAEQEARAAAERERRAREEMERERRAAEEASSRSRVEVNESSNQLKLMLGMGNSIQATAPPPVVPQQFSMHAEKAASTPKQTQQQLDVIENLAEAPPPIPQPSAWGGASQPIARKSVSEIQQEEAQAAAALAMQRDGGRSQSGGWANVAAGKGVANAWQGGNAKQRPTAVLQKQSTPASVQPRVQPTQVSRSSSSGAQIAPSQNQRQTSGSVADDFGAKMSPMLEKWCKEQMMKINGTDDLTLVSFCMTLNDPIEIRQYLTTYLGSTSQVNSFATDFINRKSGSKTQEEWETTANAKKSKKKKGGGR